MTAVDDASSLATTLAAACRRRNLAVPTGTVIAYTDALRVLASPTPSDLYWGARALFVHRPEEIAAFDEAFSAALGDGTPDDDGATAVTETVERRVTDTDDDGRATESTSALARYSRAEQLAERDFATCSEEELRETHRLIDRAVLVAPSRRSRRLVRTHRRGTRPDVRRSIGRSVRTGGELVALRRLERRSERRRIVFLLDVSGSMDAYTRQLLRLVHVGVAAGGPVEAFALGTRLTRLTRELAVRDPDRAMAAAARAVADWSGGTRLGDMLAMFNERFGVRGSARGAVVVILSDGLDRGDPAEVARQMARLRRVAYRVIWANPLKATPGYEPLARGMRAALPYVDAFVPAHSVDALADLGRLIADAASTARPVPVRAAAFRR